MTKATTEVAAAILAPMTDLSYPDVSSRGVCPLAVHRLIPVSGRMHLADAPQLFSLRARILI